jgi:predicted transcriptional regulator
MKLEGGERLVLKILRDLQGDSTDYVDDSNLATTTKMLVEDVRDWLEPLEGKGFVERARGTAGSAPTLRRRANRH